jgi:hypothetical protein
MIPAVRNRSSTGPAARATAYTVRPPRIAATSCTHRGTTTAGGRAGGGGSSAGGAAGSSFSLSVGSLIAPVRESMRRA